MNYNAINFFGIGSVIFIKNGNEVIFADIHFKLKSTYANGQYVVYNSKVKTQQNEATDSLRVYEIKAINTKFEDKICFDVELKY